MLSNDISSLHDSQAFFCTTFKSKYFQKPGTGPCPSEITVMEQPLAAWDSAAVLPFALGIHFPAVMSALQCICIFCNSFWHILVPKTSRLYMKKLLWLPLWYKVRVILGHPILLNKQKCNPTSFPPGWKKHHRQTSFEAQFEKMPVLSC